jgi:hypothetical protein
MSLDPAADCQSALVFLWGRFVTCGPNFIRSLEFVHF